MTGKIGS